MNFEKYLHELLLDNETVIVPGFGAFVSEYKPAEIKEDSDEIIPPSKTISFNPQIRNNDGLLVGYVAELKKISHFDALLKIEKERENLLYKLDSGEQIRLKGIGTLSYTAEHEITFVAEEDENLLLDSFGLETTSILTNQHEEQTPVEKTVATPQPEVEPLSQELKEDSVPKPISVGKPEKHEEKEEKKKLAWWWYLVILVPLIGVSVFIFTKGINDDLSNDETVPENTIEIVEEPQVFVATDSVKTDTIKLVETDSTPEVIAEETPEPVTETVHQSPEFYLIGGSFSVEENAETYLQELKAKGIDAFHAGKKGRFYCVGIAIYDTFSDAEKAKKEFMEVHPDIELWVWRK